jgi:glycosyltransferase involved in cell wall biosynthesis
MKYVFLSYNYSPNFTTPQSWFNRTEGYSGVLESLGKTHTVINIKRIDYVGNVIHNNVDNRFVDFGKKKTYFPFRLHQYIKSLDADIVFIHGLNKPLQVMQLRLVLSKKTRIIAQHHAEKPFQGIKGKVQRLADNCIDAYLFASHGIGAEWVAKGNISSVKKIHEVMEVSSLFYPVKDAASKLNIKASGGTMFLWVGRLNANKDPLNVVKAFLKFAESNPGVHLYMIYHTDDLLTDIKVLVGKYGDNSPVTLVGQVPHDDLLYWLNSATFFISGSYYEGGGTAVCEAMSCGCIPIVTDIPAFRMSTNNGNCGLLYEAGNEQALLDALEQAKTLDIEDKKAKSLAYFKSTLSFEAIAAQIHKVSASL